MKEILAYVREMITSKKVAKLEAKIAALESVISEIGLLTHMIASQQVETTATQVKLAGNQKSLTIDVMKLNRISMGILSTINVSKGSAASTQIKLLSYDSDTDKETVN